MKRFFPLLLCIGACLVSYAQDAGSDHTNSDDVVNEETEFDLVVESAGGVINDLSDSKKIKMTEPSYAYVNFSGFEKMPSAKNVDYKGWLEFFDGEGNYFKKRVIVNAQGNSSLSWPKKNIGIDICEDE